jgi:glucose 1-dehydrogenase
MQEKKLSGQVALVTGSKTGIGKSIAIELARAGAKVAINYTSEDASLDETKAELKQIGAEFISVKADVSKEDQVLALFQSIYDAFGTIDILVNNAGLQRDAAFWDMSLKDWQTVIDVNLTGQFLCSREAAKEFLKRGVKPEVSKAAGKIICISSVHDVIPWAGHANYAASNGGVMMLMKTMAQELAPHRIRVNSISPGAIRTKINRDAWETESALNELLKLIPYKRIGEATDIGKAAAWLASDEADYIIGATIYIDGGMTMYPEFAHGG